MVVIGIILLAVCGGLVFLSRAQNKGADELRGVERRQAGDLQQLVTEISAELGAGSFTETAELVGDVQCDQPLVSPLGERPCVYYDMSVTREVEETYYDTDSGGKKVRRTRKTTETLTSEKEACAFELRDDSGTMAILPTGASYDGLVSTVSKFETGQRGGLELGRFRYKPTELPLDKRLIGYRYDEKIIPVEGRLTVVGEVSDKMEQVALRKGDDRMVISTRTREEIVGSSRKSAKFLSILAAGFGIGGVLLVIFGLV